MATVQDDDFSSSSAHFGAATIRGRREYQQDAYFLADNFVVLADGMGGQADGDLAAKLAVDAAAAVLLQSEAEQTADIIAKAAAVGVHLWRYAEDAHAAIQAAFEKAQIAVADLIATGTYPVWNLPATTMIIAIRSEDTYYIGHLGDSRVYALVKVNKNITRLAVQTTMEQVTVDHETASGSITRYVGANSDEFPDFYMVSDVQQLVVATDGLFGYGFNDDAIYRFVSDHVTFTPEEAAVQLVSKAFVLGSEDNITAIIGR